MGAMGRFKRKLADGKVYRGNRRLQTLQKTYSAKVTETVAEAKERILKQFEKSATQKKS